MTLLTKENSVKPEAVKNIINSLVLAFSADPIARWMYPSARQYLGYFPDFMMAYGKKALDLRTVYYPNNYAGAAFWFPPNVKPDEEAVVETIQQTISPERQAEVFSLLEQMSHFYPSKPYWYLGILGVDPSQQNQGYGSNLIQAVLDLCDRSSLPAYLESSNRANLAFYEKHNFKVIGEIQTPSSPIMFPMIRYPENKQKTLII